MKNAKESEEDITKTEDTTTISSSSSKKYKKKRNTYYTPINFNIEKKSLPKIKEEKNIAEEDDNFRLLSDSEGKDNDNYISLLDDIDKNQNEKNAIDIDDNKKKDKKLSKKKKEKSGNDTYKTKEENFIDITNYKSKSKEYPEENNTKNELEFFLDEEEKQQEQEDDFKIYIQKAYDEEEQFKIIYELNKLPFKPKKHLIDLSIFDNSSLLKCFIKYYFEKTNQQFILKLYFIYTSNQSSSYLEEDKQSILDFLEKKIDSEEKGENDSNKEDNENQENENIQSEEDTLGLTLQIKKFRISNGKERNGTRRRIKIKKSDDFKDFNAIIEIN